VANYVNSPVAKLAMTNGSLNTQNSMTRTFNRKLKMRDTFTKIFPSYTHEDRTVMIPSFSHQMYSYPAKNDLGAPTHEIDRNFTHKKDNMKIYHESILKIANMRRT